LELQLVLQQVELEEPVDQTYLQPMMTLQQELQQEQELKLQQVLEPGG